MTIESEIENYLSSRHDNKPAESLEFLTKLWQSERLSTHKKFDSILKYFTTRLIPHFDDVDITKLQEFLRLAHPTGSVTDETRLELVKSVIKELKKSPSIQKNKIALEIASLESFRGFFKQNLSINAKLFRIILQTVSSLPSDCMPLEETAELKCRIVEGLFLLVNVEGYDRIFLDEILVPLSDINKDDSSRHELLLRNIFFHEVGSMESKLTIFKSELEDEQRLILIESFLAIHKSKPAEIARLFATLNEKFGTLEDNDDFLQKIGQLFELIMKHEIEYSTLKKQNAELFDELSARIISSLSESQESMELQDFLHNVTIFFTCDPFLLEKSLYSLIIDCMFKEKSSKEMQSFEKLMVAVLKVYGKDLSEFMVKFLKKLDKKLGKYNIPKMKKRKMNSESESTPNKKRKTSETSSNDIHEDSSNENRFWPPHAMLEFSEICGGMNVAQTTKIISVLNSSLVSCLEASQQSSGATENVLFKINMLCSLLCSIFEYSRVMEQLMTKTTEIVGVVKQISTTLELFGQVVLNVEYNSRLVNDYLGLMKNVDAFLMLFSYHYDTDIEHDFDAVFNVNQLQEKQEWKSIQKRIKKFGQFGELNNLNLLMIQQKEREKIFNTSKIALDITTLLNDEAQLASIFNKPEMKFFIINSMSEEQIETFVDFIVKTENDEMVNSFADVVTKNLNLTQKFTKSLSDKTGRDDKVLSILTKFPLWCATDEVKQVIFQRILDSKIKSSNLAEIVEKMCRHDGFKNCLKDFKMKQICDKFGSSPSILEMVLKNSAKKMNQQVLENFNWILEKGDVQLIKILSAVVNEINLTPGSGATADLISQFKKQLVEKVISIDCNSISTLKMIKDNYSQLDQKLQGVYSEKLLNFVKSEENRSKDDIRFLNSILKDAKKLNLSDEIKRESVVVLQTFAKTISKRDSSAIGSDFTTESETLLMLNVYKSDFLNEYLNNLIENCNYNNHSQLIQLCQIFKITVEAKDTKDDDKKSVKFIEKYLNFLRNYSNGELDLSADGLSVNIAILETNNSIMKDNKIQLNTTQIDQMLSFAANTRIIENLDDIQQFCKFMSVLGETLFIVSVVRQSYFKDRSPHYFNIYKSFVERIYFFKNGSNDDFSPVEVSSLLKLTLQAENIIKTALKNHEKALKSVNCYIVSSVVNVLVQNPKTLSLGGNKFKVNIKNICHHLLSTFEEKTRKYVYRVADETTQEVYNELFGELKRKS